MPWPDITVTPWYLIYRKIQAALTLIGFKGILDDITELEYQNIEKWSKDIVKLCVDSHLARTRRSCGKQHCKPKSNNCVTVLRRELKSVFGIMLQMTRNGRQRIKTYKLLLPKPLINLAKSSSFFSYQKLPPVQRLSQNSKLNKKSSTQKEGDIYNQVQTYTNGISQKKNGVYIPGGIPTKYLTNVRYCGLQNNGNLCYINTLFRLLSASFLPYIFKCGSTPLVQAVTSTSSAKIPLISILYYEWLSDSKPRDTPLHLNSFAHYVQNTLGLGTGQHDISELFNKIIPVIDEECHSIHPADILSFTRQKKFFCWSNTHPPYAVNCDTETYLPLPVPKCGEVNLHDLVNGEGSIEMNNSHKCRDCGYTGTNSRLHFHSTSKFFNVYIKRIEHNMNNQTKKLKTKVRFTTKLDIRVPNPDDEKVEHIIKYELISFVNHLGAVATSGHYVAMVKCGQDWQLHDDEYISTLDIAAVFSEHTFENVYILSYCRLD